jgi:hypothetical protein
MLIEGPVGAATGVLITFNDPSPSSSSVAVQIQNATSFNLLTSALGRTFMIGPNTASTMVAYGGIPVTVMPEGSAASSSGNGITAIWLSAGERNPQDDGAIPVITQQPAVSAVEQIAPDFNATGLPGATAGARFVGGTTSGPPLSGTFATNDYVISATGQTWYCTAGGTPGTWVPAVGSLIGRAVNAATVDCPANSTVTVLTLAVSLQAGLRYTLAGRHEASVVGAATTFGNAAVDDSASLLAYQNMIVWSENTLPLGGVGGAGVTTLLSPAGNVSDTITMATTNGAGAGSILRTLAGFAELIVVRAG